MSSKNLIVTFLGIVILAAIGMVIWNVVSSARPQENDEDMPVEDTTVYPVGLYPSEIVGRRTEGTLVSIDADIACVRLMVNGREQEYRLEVDTFGVLRKDGNPVANISEVPGLSSLVGREDLELSIDESGFLEIYY